MKRGELNLNLPKKRSFQVKGTFIKRSIAFFIDLLILQFIVIAPVRSVMGKLIPAGSLKEMYNIVEASGASTGIIYTISFFISLMIFIYFAFTEYYAGQSIGKKAMGLFVVPAERSGRLSLFQVVLRNLVVFPFFPFVVLWVVDPVYMMFTKNQNRLSDAVAKTDVIQTVQYV